MVRPKLEAVVLISFIATTLAVLNAFHKQKQFYPSIVYLTKSNLNLAVVYFQVAILMLIIVKLLKLVFFGELRVIEVEHLMDRSWFAITETCLAFTVFRDDFSPRFVAMFSILLLFKCVHWLTEDRVEFAERTAVITTLFHTRIVGLIGLLLFSDAFFIVVSYNLSIVKGASVQLVFGFEYAILLVSVIAIGIKYVLHIVDMQRDHPWESKGMYMLYSELFTDFLRVLIYCAFVTIMVKIYTLPLFTIRPFYLAIRSLKKSWKNVILSRRAIAYLNSMYPNVTEAELSQFSDLICIICREEMSADQQIKLLPCNHIFHKACLHNWFQRQQTCPTCRIDILRRHSNRFTNRHDQNRNPQQQQNQNLGADENNNPHTGVPSGEPGSYVHMAGFPSFLPATLPPFAFPPPPLPTLKLSDCSAEELRMLERTEYERLVSRVKMLQNIRTCLDAACIQLGQYINVSLMDDGASRTETVNQSQTSGATENSQFSNEEIRKRRLQKMQPQPANQ